MEGDNPLITAEEGDFKRLIDFALEKKPFVPWPIYDVMEEKAIANRDVNEVIFEAITRIEAPEESAHLFREFLASTF